jgi:phage terminase large subunit-like protein
MPGVTYLNNNEYFDDHDARTAVHFIEEYCTFVKGERAGQRFYLQEWQAEIVRSIFGCKLLDGRRRYRCVWIDAPRKSGKSTLAAAILLYMLLVDKEHNAEIYLISSTMRQAAVSLNIAKDMVENDRDMQDVCTTYRNEIHYGNNTIVTLTASSSSVLGRDISCAVLDDMQGGLTAELLDNLISSMAARRQPLLIYLATAGWSQNFVARELHQYAKDIQCGKKKDPSWLVCTFGAKEQDDWTDPMVWKRAHPGLGYTISLNFLQEQCARALRTPVYAQSFKRLYLNIWTQRSSQWLDSAMWDECGADLDRESLTGRSCRIGLDLSSTTDLTAAVVVFSDYDGGYTVLSFSFCPNDSIRRRSHIDNVNYEKWKDEGYLIATEGNVVDYCVVKNKILDLCKAYDVREVAYDRWGSSMLITELVDSGIRCVPVSQNATTLSAAALDLERVVKNRKLRHDNDPVLRWCASNVHVETKSDGSLKPSKRRSRERIDLIIALLLAISRIVAETTSSGINT